MKQWKKLGMLFFLLLPVVMVLAAAPPAPSAFKNGVLHGDTSIPDEQLVKKYGDKIPAEVLMDDFSKKMPPVKFPHKKHVEKKVCRCGNCHHKEINDIKPCSKCHVEKPQDPKVPPYDKAHHGLCVDCHKTKQKPDPNQKPGEPAKTIGPPIKCILCHKKENKPQGK